MNVPRQSVVTNDNINIYETERVRLEQRDPEHLKTRSRYAEPHKLQRFGLEGSIRSQHHKRNGRAACQGAGETHRRVDSACGTLRRRLLAALGRIAYAQGDHVTAVTATDQAADLASRLGGAARTTLTTPRRATSATSRSRPIDSSFAAR